MQITVNETGARTIADSRPMMIDGLNVYVVLGAGTASLMIGGRIVAERDASDMSTTEAQAWAVSYRDGLAAVEEAVNPESVYAGAVASVRGRAVALLAEAAVEDAHGEGPYKHRSQVDGRTRTYDSSDPRHPARRAEHLRRNAAILASWTGADEKRYMQYVSDGIGDTDGYYAPEDRAAWKAFLSA